MLTHGRRCFEDWENVPKQWLDRLAAMHPQTAPSPLLFVLLLWLFENISSIYPLYFSLLFLSFLSLSVSCRYFCNVWFLGHILFIKY